ncbi:MAG: S8 family serine peptidase, partial [Chloroflexota bacterium]
MTTSNPEKDEYVPNRLIVTMKPSVSQESVNLLATTYNVDAGEPLPHVGSYVWQFQAEDDLKTVQQNLANDPAVSHVEFDYIYRLLDVAPTDPSYDQQWALPQIQAHKAWEVTKGNKGVVLAIIDTGIDTTHPDLHSKLTPRNTWYDFGNNDTNPRDVNGHGTHVAGIAGAVVNNKIGIAGLAWNAQILPIKVFPDHKNGASTSAIARGILHAVSMGADVINLSLGSTRQSRVIRDAIRYTHEQSVVVVAAAGNDNNERLFYPAAFDHVISVCSTQRQDIKSGFSNFGNWVNVCAPGSGILSTVPGGRYANYSGTSMASPYVAGLAALLKSQKPMWNSDQVENRIVSTADNIDSVNRIYSGRLGSGRINTFNAVKESNREQPTISGTPECVSWGSNRIDCFVRGGDNAMYHRWWNGSHWKGWESLGGRLTSAPECVSWGPNRIDCFVRGEDNAMHHRWWNGSQWGGWESLGGKLTSAPECVSWEPNRIDCFVRGGDNAMHHRWWNGSRWKGWESLGGKLTSAPECVSWEPNRIDCFVRGGDNAMHHRWWNGSRWKGWESLGG